MFEIKAFKCEGCSKIYQQKASAKKHESKCFFIEENKACATCANSFTPTVATRQFIEGIGEIPVHHVDRDNWRCLSGASEKLTVHCKSHVTIEKMVHEADHRVSE